MDFFVAPDLDRPIVQEPLGILQPELMLAAARIECVQRVLNTASLTEKQALYTASAGARLCSFDVSRFTLCKLSKRPELNGMEVETIGADAEAKRLEVRLVLDDGFGEAIRVKPENMVDQLEAWYMFYAILIAENERIDQYHLAGCLQDLAFADIFQLPTWQPPTFAAVKAAYPWMKPRWFELY